MSASNIMVACWFALMALNIFMRFEPAQKIVDWVCKFKVGAYVIALMRRVGPDPVQVIESAERLLQAALEKESGKP